MQFILGGSGCAGSCPGSPGCSGCGNGCGGWCPPELHLGAGTEHRHWYYLDSTEQEYGPFSEATLRLWYSQGHFPMGEELQVRLPSWDRHFPLRILYPQGTPFYDPPSTHHLRYGGMPPQQGSVMPDQMPYAPMASGGGSMMTTMDSLPAGVPSMPHYAAQQAYACGDAAAAHQGTGRERYTGFIKSFNPKAGFGFIECAELFPLVGRDVFLHKAQIGPLQQGDEVVFGIEYNRDQYPQARDLVSTGRSVDMSGAPAQQHAKGANGAKGKGGGKGRGAANGGGGGEGKKGRGATGSPKGKGRGYRGGDPKQDAAASSGLPPTWFV